MPARSEGDEWHCPCPPGVTRVLWQGCAGSPRRRMSKVTSVSAGLCGTPRHTRVQLALGMFFKDPEIKARMEISTHLARSAQ